jgi:Ca-activated chloride channel family protein
MAETRIRGEGIALMLVVDCSGSMDARDLVPTDVQQNRLAVVRSVLQEFLMGPDGKHPQRPQDLIGAVAFAAFADGVCPLTLDHANLAQLIQELELASPDEDGTAIGDGLGLAVLRLRTSPVASKVIILLTDGENNTGALEPMPAARLAQESKIRVHCIGAGSRGVAPIPVRDPYGRVALRMARVTIDEECLKRIAQATGGRYFRATDANSLSEIYSEIDRLERTEISEIRYLQYDEHFSDWTLAGLGLFLAGLASEIIWFRSLP